jgi:hypothetical protein
MRKWAKKREKCLRCSQRDQLAADREQLAAAPTTTGRETAAGQVAAEAGAVGLGAVTARADSLSRGSSATMFPCSRPKLSRMTVIAQKEQALRDAVAPAARGDRRP